MALYLCQLLPQNSQKRTSRSITSVKTASVDPALVIFLNLLLVGTKVPSYFISTFRFNQIHVVD